MMQLQQCLPNRLSGLGCHRSRTQQRGWDHRDSIRAAVGSAAGVDDDHVPQVFAELLLQPQQVLYVGVVHTGAQLDLHPDARRAAVHDEIHFVVAPKWRRRQLHPRVPPLS